MKNSDSHFYLYAKGHYQRDDSIEDLKILLGEYCGTEPSYLSVDDVLSKMVSLVHKEFSKDYTEYKFTEFMSDILPRNRWKFINDVDEVITLEEVIIKKCLSVLRFARVKDLGGNDLLNLDKPDKNILPLKKEAV